MLNVFPFAFPVFKFGGFNLFPTYYWSLVTLGRGAVFTVIHGHVRLNTGDAFGLSLSHVVIELSGPVFSCPHTGSSVLLAPVVIDGSHDAPPHPSFSCP